MVCSQINTATTDDNAQHAQHTDKMAFQVEMERSHAHVGMYGGVKVREEPKVHCRATPDCDWQGNYEEIVSHCKQCHPNSIWWTGDQKRSFKIEDITKDSYHCELVVAYGNLFWLHVKNDLNSNQMYAACQHIIVKNEDPHTKYMIRTELCDAEGMNCISCSTETRPYTEDLSKILNNHHCAARPLSRLQSFIHDNSLTLSVNITKMYYYQ